MLDSFLKDFDAETENSFGVGAFIGIAVPNTKFNTISKVTWSSGKKHIFTHWMETCISMTFDNFQKEGYKWFIVYPQHDFVPVEGEEAGEKCNRFMYCDGTISEKEIEGGCYCFRGNPPCGHCTAGRLKCDECGWEEEDA